MFVSFSLRLLLLLWLLLLFFMVAMLPSALAKQTKQSETKRKLFCITIPCGKQFTACQRWKQRTVRSSPVPLRVPRRESRFARGWARTRTADQLDVEMRVLHSTVLRSDEHSSHTVDLAAIRNFLCANCLAAMPSRRSDE